jgi:hypothetical protein
MFYNRDIDVDRENCDYPESTDNWDEDDGVIVGAHSYNKNCSCYLCDPPGFMPGD